MDVIRQLAESLRKQVESKPTGVSSATIRSGTLFAYLSHYGGHWRLELSDDEQIPGDVVHAWVRWCGAPDGTPVLFSCGGRMQLAMWER